MRPEPGAALLEPKSGGTGYITLRKVRELPAGWVEVETACVRNSISSCDYLGIQLRLFVQSVAFLPVLLQRLRLHLADGSSHVFPVGTPVEPGAEPGRQVVQEFGVGPAVVPVSAVGRVYKAAKYAPSKSELPSQFGRNSAVGNHLPAKTLLYWSDGSAAGQLVTDHLIELEIEKRPCFHYGIGRYAALLCGGVNALDPVGAAMQEAFQKPQGEPQ